MRKQTIKKISLERKKDFTYALNETGEYRDTWRIFRIMSEFVEGYQFLSQFKRMATVFGSARISPDNKYYEHAEKVGKMLAKHKFTVVTGGGPGIMEAANKGANEMGGESVGLNIQLPFEQRVNPYVTKSTAFYYFFTRKVMLSAPSHAFIFFPGGFGTLDEFFEIVDIMDLGKMYKSPIILFGKEFWDPLIEFMKNSCKTLTGEHLEEIKHWHVVDSVEEAEKIIKDVQGIDICDLAPMNFVCDRHIDWKIFRIMSELVEGFEFLTGLVEDVTVLGSKSIRDDSRYYMSAYDLGKMLVKDGFSVVTGGGFGTAEAVNKGAKKFGGDSIGIAMELSGGIKLNDYITRSITTTFPFVRKLLVTAPSKGFVFYPGRFGTMHQLFEVLELIQTKKMAPIPVLLYDHKFWDPLHQFIKKVLVYNFSVVSPEDDEIYQIIDDEKTAIKILKEFRRARPSKKTKRS